MKILPIFKTGDTFIFTAVIKDTIYKNPMIGISSNLKSQIRRDNGTFVAELIISEVLEIPGNYEFSANDTSNWPIENLYMDIQYTDEEGIITSSESLVVPIEKDVTR